MQAQRLPAGCAAGGQRARERGCWRSVRPSDPADSQRGRQLGGNCGSGRRAARLRCRRDGASCFPRPFLRGAGLALRFRVGRERRRRRRCYRGRERLGDTAAMNRFFGKAKPKEPPPSLTDCIGKVSARPGAAGPAERCAALPGRRLGSGV